MGEVAVPGLRADARNPSLHIAFRHNNLPHVGLLDVLTARQKAYAARLVDERTSPVSDVDAPTFAARFFHTGPAQSCGVAVPVKTTMSYFLKVAASSFILNPWRDVMGLNCPSRYLRSPAAAPVAAKAMARPSAPGRRVRPVQGPSPQGEANACHMPDAAGDSGFEPTWLGPEALLRNIEYRCERTSGDDKT